MTPPTSLIGQAEARAAEAEERLRVAERERSALRESLREAIARERDAQTRVVEIEQRVSRLAEWLRAAEAREANALARLEDAERDKRNLQNWLSAAEAREANALSRLRDAEQTLSARAAEILAVQAALRLASGQTSGLDLASRSNTPVENLLNEYALFDLSTLVKTRRLRDERFSAETGGRQESSLDHV